MTSPPSHYEILNLPQNGTQLTPQLLKTAYHRALLLHHPDKADTATVNRTSNKTTQQIYTIDQIATAFTVLGDVKARGRYDAELKLRYGGGVTGKAHGGEAFGGKIGGEGVDLDDMDEGDGVWWRGCRCGQERGFEVTEADLEDAMGEGEVVVGCKGCSLWLRVLFGIVEDLPGDGKEEIVGHG